MTSSSQWDRFKGLYFESRAHGFALDISRMNFPNDFPGEHLDSMRMALEDMAKLEAGAIANRDEKRMVGHYWLRDFKRAPNKEVRTQISTTLLNIKIFAEGIHTGKIQAPGEKQFDSILVIGIGGSALGPEFVNHALGTSADPMRAYFFDNTDPDGMSKTLAAIPDLSKTICIVISKSGGTKETRNGQMIARAAFESAGLEFSKYAVAVTGEDSELDQTATEQKWLARFPMWDWVGGRTSELSAVGLLPAALQGFDVDSLLQGAREMDELTRRSDAAQNPAALMAMMWLYIGKGKGLKDMVILPYKDRLELFSRYLQQLVMESLGKELNLDGEHVNQGLAVYGNKGSTDQHAYVQQLRDGINNFFVTFIEVIKDKANLPRLKWVNHFDSAPVEVEPDVNCGDYLSGFLLGTRKALHDNGRESITITIDEVSAYSIGQLIALFERTVGLYASLINVNAYHQPGVEAGKKAAAEILNLQGLILSHLATQSEAVGVDQIVQAINSPDSIESAFKILRRLAGTGRVLVKPGSNTFADGYQLNKS